MKDPGDAIEKVLSGLRNTDAPVGMERRILEGLQARSSVRSQSGWRRLRPVWMVAPVRPAVVGFLAWGVAVAAVIAAGLAAPSIRRPGHVVLTAKTASIPVQSIPPVVPEEAASSAQLSPQPHLRFTKPVNTSTKVSARSTEKIGASDSLAFDEMHAASHPAPPMPLTGQEKLLLRIAHKGDPVEFAELDPVQRAARDAEEKAEVERFFVPGKTGDYE